MKTRLHTTDALDIVLEGAEQVYRAVSSTMGPRGQNVIIKKYGKRVFVTHDGVTVAKSLDVQGSPAAELLVGAATKLDATTGDGTTTVTVLAYNLLVAASERIKAGENPMRIKLELEKAQKVILNQIEKHTNKKVTQNELVAVASVSAGSKEVGEEIGKLISEAGEDTPIMLGYSDATETYTEIINGFKIDSGPASPYLMEGAGVRHEIENPKVIVVDAKLLDKGDVMPLFQEISSLPGDERKFLLVVNDIASDALSLMVVNRLKGFADIAVAKVPAHIQSRTEYLQDVAVSTGATLLSRNSGNTITDPHIEQFGTARKVIIEPRETVIVSGAAIGEDMAAHTQSLETMAKDGKDLAVRKFAEDRLKTLKQKVVSVRVGGQTESEAQERYYRYEDAVGAARAALRGGVVPGGGTLLYSIDSGNKTLNEALKAPLTKVLANAGVAVPEGIKPGLGVDVLDIDGGLVDLTERGILDPAESEIESVKTAIAIAGLLMTSGAIIVDELTETKTSESKQQISPN